MSGRLVFLDECRSASVYCGGHARQDDTQITLRPNVGMFLRSQGLQSVNTLPYFTNASHAKTLLKSQDIVAWIQQQQLSLSDDADLQRTLDETVVFWVRLAVHYCLWLIETGSNAVDSHQPDALLTVGLGKRGMVATSMYVEPEEHCVADIMGAIAASHGISHTDIRQPDRARIGLWIRCQQWVHNIQVLGKLFLRRAVIRHYQWKPTDASIRESEREVWYTTVRYHLGDLVNGMRSASPDRRYRLIPSQNSAEMRVPDMLVRVCWPQAVTAVDHQREALRELASRMASNTEQFVYRGIPFGHIVAQKLEGAIADHVVGMTMWASEVEELARVSCKPSIMLSVGNRCDEQLLTALCRKAGSPSVLISHGSHVRPKNTLEEIEWGEHGKALMRAPFSHVALQSRLAEGFTQAFPSTSTPVKTGPLIWGMPIDPTDGQRAFQQLFGCRYQREQVRVVMHAGTAKASNSLRLHVYETPDEYLQSIIELAAVVERMPDTVLVVKFRPMIEIAVEDIRALVPFSERVVLSVDEPFYDVLAMTDVLVSFSSTTIEEALQNCIPVLQFGGGGRYQHVRATTVTSDSVEQEAAVYHVSDPNCLESALALVLARQEGSAQDTDLFAPYRYRQDEHASLAELRVQ
jgi:hypothetical protein